MMRDMESRARASRFIPICALVAAAGCAASGGTHLPWGLGTAAGGRADVDSVLAAVRVEWNTEDGTAMAPALEAVLAECAARRGYRLAAEGAASEWVVAQTDGGSPPPAGEPPLDASGYAAALAERVRRASPRAVPPTRAGIELRMRKFGTPVWTGLARYDPDPAREAGGAADAVRQLAAMLPDFRRTPRPLRRVAPDSVVTFYRDALEGKVFDCPVLPYPIRFPDLERAYLRGGRELRWEDTVNSDRHDDATLLPSVLDLVHGATAALPQSIPGYVDLAGAEIWRKVTLFEMFSGPDGTEVALEVRLEGDTRGYEVRESRVLDRPAAERRREELAEFSRATARYFEHRGR